jgi:hypothetical protein
MSPKSESEDDKKVVELPVRLVSGVIKRGLSGIESDALYVFKLGPVETEEGRCSVYFPVLGDGAPFAPAVVASDSKGLAALAPLFQGRRLYCEPRLARAGAAYGFVSRPLPPELLPVRAVMALSTRWGSLGSEIPPEFFLRLVDQILEVAMALWQARPWELWTDIEVFELRLEGGDSRWREGCLLGNGGEEFGFALYSKPGSVERLGELAEEERLQELLSVESLALSFQDEPVWVRSAVHQATRLPLFPLALRISDGDFAPVRQEDLMVLLAVARALTRLSPEELEPRGEVSLGGLQVTARVRAHLPLFTARRSSPPALPRGTGPAAPEAAVERPPLPHRKISETLLSFVQPLIPEPVGGDPNLMMVLLELGVTAWNAVVLDTWEPGPDRVGAVRAAVQALPRARRKGLLPLFEELVERKRRDFPEDCRLMSGLQVHWSFGGEPSVRLEARLPDSFRAAR